MTSTNKPSDSTTNQTPEERLEKALAAMQVFVKRVESGEVRSVATYNKFKEILKENNYGLSTS